MMAPIPTEIFVRRALELRNQARRHPRNVALSGARYFLRLARCQVRLGRPLTDREADEILRRDLQPWEL